MSEQPNTIVDDVVEEMIASSEFTGGDLKQWIEAHGLTQKKAATLLGRGDRQIRNWIKEPEKTVPRYIQWSCQLFTFRVNLETSKRARQG